ncbi:MAG: hypothetical protein A2261_02045 [Candidatus Magasanikbacteria bacterium RIFOXYA2_FULL_44_8]|uniref:Uncharacterized protein n=1 Tax=Candidatus Magasanikbacteria bacterium RIFOXYA2_FULL_44_8 TaxID=1798696 RepID=A0A1F6NLB0_9BACT|nr:MAG: hypothetical protein A2261_02045 [Candidatus Magasanikbacteria bacterium RIFOXYA2_FULL_44_8]
MKQRYYLGLVLATPLLYISGTLLTISIKSAKRAQKIRLAFLSDCVVTCAFAVGTASQITAVIAAGLVDCLCDGFGNNAK